MQGLRELFKDKDWKVVYCVALWVCINKKWKRQVIIDKGVVNSAERLVGVFEQVRNVDVKPETREVVEPELGRFLEWLCIDSGKTLRFAYKYVIDFFQRTEEDEVVDEFIRAYVKYVKERFDVDYVVGSKGNDARKAALVTKKMAEKYGISMYQVIKFQHEWWPEGIKTPFTFKALGREEKVEERLQKYFAKRRGEVIEKKEEVEEDYRNIPGAYFLKRRWEEVLSMGPTKFLQIAKGGFLADICREMVEELRKTQDKRAVLQKYTSDYVLKEWLRRGKPMIFY